MKSDKTEVILLGAAAAVIALVVAFSMMSDKGNKRSREDEEAETARNVEQKVEEDVDELEDTAKKIDSNLTKAEGIVRDLKGRVPPDSRPGRAIAKVESAVERAKPVVQTISSLIPDETKEELKNAALEKAKSVGRGVFNRLKDAALESFNQNAPWKQKPKEIPLPSDLRPTRPPTRPPTYRPRDDRRNSW